MLRLPPHTPESVDLLWYTAGTGLIQSRKYMLALLRAEELFQAGSLTQILHGQPVQYYQMILDGEHTGSPLVALEDKPRAALTLDVDTVACSVKLGNDEDAAVLRPRKRARQGSVDAPAANADAIEDAIEDAIMSEGLSSESLSAEALFYSPSEQEEVGSQEPGAGFGVLIQNVRIASLKT